MRFLTALVVASVLVSAWARAQEPLREGERPPDPERAPAPTPEPPPACGVTPPPGCPNLKILWYERFKPISVLNPREVITWEPVRTLDVVPKPKTITVEELIVKSRDVQQPYTCTTYVPVTVKCPHTGHCSTVMEPRTETKMRTVTVWYAEPVKREVEVLVPELAEVEDLLERRSILLEHRTELLREGGAMKIEAGEVQKPFYLQPPKPECPVPH